MATKPSNPPRKLGGATVLIGVLLVILLMAVPLVFNHESQFAGSDGAGSDLIRTLAPDYDSTWIANWWTPPGSETESMLFALQATAGGLLIGYFFGYMRGKRDQ